MILNYNVTTALLSQRITQLLCILVLVHQLFQLFTVYLGAHRLQLSLNLLQPLVDNIHTEVKDKVLNLLLQVGCGVFFLKTLAELMTVYTQGGCQLTDLRIRMLHEVAIGLEPFISSMLYCFLQNLVIELVGKLQTIF